MVKGIEEAVAEYNNNNCSIRVMLNKEKRIVYCEFFSNLNNKIKYNTDNIVCIKVKDSLYPDMLSVSELRQLIREILK